MTIKMKLMWQAAGEEIPIWSSVSRLVTINRPLTTTVNFNRPLRNRRLKLI